MNMRRCTMTLRTIGCCVGLMLLMCGLSITETKAQANENWHLEKDKDQIQVYARKIPGNGLSELKVECLMTGTQTQLVALLSDITNYENVIYKTKQAKLLRRVSEKELFYYVVSALPWPVSDRDMAVRLTFDYDPDTRLLHVRGVGVPNLVAPKPNRVRITDWFANWQVRQVASNQMKVTYTVRFDPGGNIPSWLDNVAAATSAHQSFSMLRQSLALPRYQGKSFAFLQ